MKLPSNLHIPKRNVGFSEANDSENIQIKRSTAAFQRLQRQHDRKQLSTSVTRIPENHKTLPSGSGLNELSSDDFSVFNLKYDCSKASHYFTGLSLEGSKGSYKKVLEYSGRSVDPNLMKKGDFLLSIDGNDVRNMSMCGLSAFLKKTVERKSANMRNPLQKSKSISMKKRYVSMTFRRMTLDIGKTRAIELTTKPTQKAVRVDNINVLEKTKKTERLSSSPPVHAQEPFPEKEPTQVRQSRSRLASDSHDDTIDDSNSKSPETPEVKRQRVSPCESSVDDDIVSSDTDSVENTAFDQQVRLIKRMSAGSKIFVNTHPAEVLKIDINALSIQVKWESGMKSWIEIDHEKMSLQDDILQTSRRR